MNTADTLNQIWQHLGWPLIRLLMFISLGLLFAGFIEALNWTRQIAVIARPLTKFARLSPLTGASFSMAFFSGVAANTMLSEGFEKNEISKKELILANLFNSLPTYFLHLPTTFFIVAPLIKGAAFIYIGLTFGAALLRTMGICLISRFLLPAPAAEPQEQKKISQDNSLRSAWNRTWIRFKRRIKKIIRFTVPIYILFYVFNQIGVFAHLEQFMSRHLSFLSWLSPGAMSIITLHVATEFTAGLAAAGALLADGTMSSREIILALLVGNILSSPIRAFRHQFPYYAGIFKPALALQLILFSQSFRLFSIVTITILYLFLF
ncbi:MAG TPA: hypothetical protein ENI88_00865 [Desulfobulbus sp.]|nr:hypothetical protein [Desulfobulbus sp.]